VVNYTKLYIPALITICKMTPKIYPNSELKSLGPEKLMALRSKLASSSKPLEQIAENTEIKTPVEGLNNLPQGQAYFRNLLKQKSKNPMLSVNTSSYQTKNKN